MPVKFKSNGKPKGVRMTGGGALASGDAEGARRRNYPLLKKMPPPKSNIRRQCAEERSQKQIILS